MSDAGLLEKLDKIPKLRQFDAFPKTQPTYVRHSSRGGLATVVLILATLMVIWVEFSGYMRGEHDITFDVDSHISRLLQINMDITVATPCSKLSVDLRDASGESVHFDEKSIAKDETEFKAQIKTAQSKRRHTNRLNALDAPKLSGRVSRKDKVYGPNGPRDKNSGFEKTYPLLSPGPACRIYGSLLAKKVTGNLHISAPMPLLAMGDQASPVNMSHVITELSFGVHFPYMAEPLDSSLELTKNPSAIYQYFLSVVPTNYFKSRRKIRTNQYSVTDYKRNPNSPGAFPGIFFKYDIEPLTMTIHNRSMSFVSFVVRLTGILGGIWLCTNFALRTLSRLLRLFRRTSMGRDFLDKMNVSTAPTGGDTPLAQSPAQPQGICGKWPELWTFA
ncbi:hypothetical protein MYAM1_000675 [Malassezia yamatoensis]|uniref:Uncharacterized protein n=1 Tax=Malassezia yamatoensis TaxID=253288 RepID=A0AAJ5YRM3_9BASI|nr:hypothetical protein MYAM1_000675 [Malassezia yamatoensis]